MKAKVLPGQGGGRRLMSGMRYTMWSLWSWRAFIISMRERDRERGRGACKQDDSEQPKTNLSLKNPSPDSLY